MWPSYLWFCIASTTSEKLIQFFMNWCCCLERVGRVYIQQHEWKLRWENFGLDFFGTQKANTHRKVMHGVKNFCSTFFFLFEPFENGLTLIELQDCPDMSSHSLICKRNNHFPRWKMLPVNSFLDDKKESEKLSICKCVEFVYFVICTLLQQIQILIYLNSFQFHC